LIEFAVQAIRISQMMKTGEYTKHYANQLVRSTGSSALNYGEMQSAESKSDFIHKGSVVLKELRESIINLKIIKRAGMNNKEELVSSCIKENNELISIFYKTIQTTRKNQQNR